MTRSPRTRVRGVRAVAGSVRAVAAAGRAWASLCAVLWLAVACTTEIKGPPCPPDSPLCKKVSNDPPRLFVDPPFGLGFDCVTLGCVTENTLSVENRGGGTLKISLVRLTIDTSTDFTLTRKPAVGAAADAAPVPLPTPDSQVTLGAGESLDLLVRYAPTDGTVDNGTLEIDTYDGKLDFANAAPEKTKIPLTTRQLGDAVVQLQASTLNYGLVAVGDTHTLQVVVQNGAAAKGILAIGPVTADDGTPGAFHPPTPAAWATQFINPGQSATFDVDFSPDSVSPFLGALTLASNDPQRPNVHVSLAGTAIADPRLSIADPQGAIDFGDIRAGEARQRPVTLANLGGAPLTLTPGVTGDGAFSVDGAGSPITIQPLESATVTVHTAPNVGGPLAGQLVLSSDDPTNPTAAIDLSAFCDDPEPSIGPPALDFGQIVQGWTTPAQALFISNSGTGSLTITNIQFETGSSNEIQIASVPNLPIKLAPGDEPAQVAIFVQANVLGPAQATLLVSTDGVNTSVVRVTINANIVSCQQGCPVSHGIPECSAGQCEIGSCNTGFHDTDHNFGDGCECQEDPQNGGHDISGNCPGLDMGTIGDKCFGGEHEVFRSGTLDSESDVDLFFVRSVDDNSFPTCDVTSDSYKLTVELTQSLPGMQLCIRNVGSGGGCGGENQRDCSQLHYEVGGSFGNDDSHDTTIWVQWAPGVPPVCGNYQLHVNAKK